MVFLYISKSSPLDRECCICLWKKEWAKGGPWKTNCTCQTNFPSIWLSSDPQNISGCVIYGVLDLVACSVMLFPPALWNTEPGKDSIIQIGQLKKMICPTPFLQNVGAKWKLVVGKGLLEWSYDITVYWKDCICQRNQLSFSFLPPTFYYAIFKIGKNSTMNIQMPFT